MLKHVLTDFISDARVVALCGSSRHLTCFGATARHPSDVPFPQHHAGRSKSSREHPAARENIQCCILCSPGNDSFHLL